jgi:hypothetical protein
MTGSRTETGTGIQASGGCLCGAVRYRVSGAPKWTANCHCASCRRATGAVMTSYAGFASERFEYERGTPVRFESSPGVRRSFCGRCGSPLTYEGERWPGEVHVLVGSLDHPENYPPAGDACVEERVAWLHLARAGQG